MSERRHVTAPHVIAPELAAAGYALFALQQSVPVEGLHPDQTSFAVTPHETPNWFAAAADDNASLLEIAPELMDAPLVELDGEVRPVRHEMDLVAMYGTPVVEPEPVDDEPVAAPNEPRAAVQIGLLREVAFLDD